MKYVRKISTHWLQRYEGHKRLSLICLVMYMMRHLGKRLRLGGHIACGLHLATSDASPEERGRCRSQVRRTLEQGLLRSTRACPKQKGHWSENATSPDRQRGGRGAVGAVGDKGRRILALMCQPASASGDKKCSLLKRFESQPTHSLCSDLLDFRRKEGKQARGLSLPTQARPNDMEISNRSSWTCMEGGEPRSGGPGKRIRQHPAGRAERRRRAADPACFAAGRRRRPA